MRSISIIFALCVLAGCAAGPSLEELTAEALQTGDWSLVEKREARIAARRQPAPKCPPGAVAYCRSFMGDMPAQRTAQAGIPSPIPGRRHLHW
jgi:hypothetical protein